MNFFVPLHVLKYCLFSSAVEQLIRNEQVVGSNPMRGSRPITNYELQIFRLTKSIFSRHKSFVIRNLKFVIIILVLASCTNPSPSAVAPEAFYTPQYAKGFYITREGGHKVLHVMNPWQGASNVHYAYRLVPRDDRQALDSSLMNIPIPLERVVCLSTTHIACIDVSDETATVVGVSGPGYVTHPAVRSAIAAGKVADVGYEGGMSYETVVRLRPDVVLAYGVAGEMSSVADKLNSMGIRVVFLGDYLEDSPLGKAEYMVAVSAFYNKEERIAEIFQAVADDYNAVKALVDPVKQRPTVLMNAPWRNAWYVPGTANYTCRLVYDAGGEVLGAHEGSRDSAPLSLELAYIYAQQADFWLHPNAACSLHELKAGDPRFATIPAFRQHRVFNNSLRRTPEGGSDFWESGVVRPHIILRDLVGILHPGLLPNHRLVYYEQLQ